MSLTVPDFSAVNILAVGDLMLDQYWFGPTSRISPEAPVPVVNITGVQARAGGAANVAVNLASLGVNTSLVGITGDDVNRGKLLELLAAQDIEVEAVKSSDQPTIMKLRVLSRNQQLIRLDTEDQFDARDAESLLPILERHISQASVCILSDYAKGTLARAPEIIALCRAHGVTVLVDPKGQDFTRYRGATVLTPNLSEFEAVVGWTGDDQQLVERGQALCAELDIESFVVTLSARGMVVITKGEAPLFLPARVREVFDVTGAGDTVIAVLAAALATGQAVTDAAALANLAAGLVVHKIGVASVTSHEMRLALHEHGFGGRGLLVRSEASDVTREARGRGERVVMTNGCFDILHQGHVAYLEEAKALGDRLLVAVNDDASVTKLKGAGRPINPVSDRMSVLAGLASVDWVVPFSEDTPADLIGEVLPDVLVKGGDYQPEEIAGADAVLSNGGTVKVLSFSEGRSTSSIIDAIRKLS
ncbi:MAG: bifunctional D-glycero-beta-D-manno-heptose-7-phosphate kinase/D-glycero-beta-D-manno-heptose 1-phosphate adenylyltransferase HldE [Gammaproteobacteria bacterium]|jgi:D-beta-D-heptose 7-phosphate kinase/D-beta-D-heptose 1-phosphate adenosyltransferase|nr:bifunctional heptose 7-phosphate kinase/heptose 1-phosphate adenyltransferase [Chromatiales bacterium]MDP6674333.1 bifunctional D-glycero-beta-D-manno-heptose-7-phosphate kinase/D-glycero-beta-D-manno-heptose 1-phosphate adenylyltransferase HldE [Gammaproteobacteria bacterium]